MVQNDKDRNSIELVSDRQAISIIVLFYIGEASIYLGGIGSAKKDLWISVIIAISMAMPIVIMYARLHSLFPRQNLFDIMEICFGKYLGKVLILLYIWGAFYATAGVIQDLGYFVRIVLFPTTPYLAPVIAFAVISAYGAKHGIEVLGRWGEFFLIVPIVSIFLVILLLIPKMNLANILPLLDNGIKPVLQGAYFTFVFPFTLIVGTTMVFSFSETKNSPYKIYITGLLIGGLLIFLTYLTVILVLGDYLPSILYYPSYLATARINIGEFVQRLDIIAAGIFMIGIYMQTVIFLLATSKGVAKLCGFPDYRFIVIPITLMVINLSSYDFDSTMRYFEFGQSVWSYYILLFEVILPLIIWITAEVKMRKKNAKPNV